jgi:hypothetical protein
VHSIQGPLDKQDSCSAKGGASSTDAQLRGIQLISRSDAPTTGLSAKASENLCEKLFIDNREVEE